MTENRGGKREGAGRKPRFTNSDTFLEQLAEAEAASIASGADSMAATIVKLAKGEDKRVAASMCKLYADKVVVGASEQEVSVMKHDGPGVLLPPEEPDTEQPGAVH